MRIGINAVYLSQNISAGVPRYIWEICKELEQIWPEAEFVLYMRDDVGVVPPSKRWTVRIEPIKALRRLKPNLWLKFRCGSLAAKDKIDVFWSATGLLPNLPHYIPGCLVVQDLNVRLVPQTMPRLTRIAYNLFFERDIRKAAMVLSGSKGTATRLQDCYGVSVSAVAPSGVSGGFAAQNPDEAAEACRRYGLNGPFCLAVGTIEPRKNILNLLRAFDILDQKGALGDHTLALVGKAGWRDAEILEAIKSYEGRWLRRLGFVPDADLAKLYAKTELFIFPSIYEGFGIPVIEARACGARVAVTDIPELCEYAGPDAIRISGTTAEDIASALEPALRSPAPRGSVALDLPTWRQSAEVTKQALCELVHRKNKAMS